MRWTSSIPIFPVKSHTGLPSQMTVSLESGYLNQRGQNIDLDLLTATG